VGIQVFVVQLAVVVRHCSSREGTDVGIGDGDGDANGDEHDHQTAYG